MNYVILDIETVPIELNSYYLLSEDERLKKVNPIDSKIIAIGLRYKNKNNIFMSKNEKDILINFWNELKEIKKKTYNIKIVGFNIINFDMPFITTRSFINNTPIIPFTLKNIVDLKNKISAYRYGPTRGKLKEFAKLMDIEILDTDGSNIADLCINDKFDTIKTYLEKDLEITDKVYLRAKNLRILEINKW